MDWIFYEQKFREKAKNHFLSRERIDELLSYSKNIFFKGFPIIYDTKHLSLLVGYEIEYIFRVYEKSFNFYRIFEIPKKNGESRLIAEPLPSLKEIQNWILNNIISKSSPSRFCKAYIKGHSIKSNAKFHKNKEIVLGIDISNYFPSITVDKVKTYFLSIGYNNEIATILSKLCCLDECLPQGAPTSPMLSNLITSEIDQRIYQLIKPLKITYTRYADDLTFSGSFDVGFVINKVRNILQEFGFTVNHDKIRAQGRHQKQLVTGVVVNKKMQVDRKKRRNLRQIMFYINKFGFESHFAKLDIRKKNYIEHLIGLANYILFINPNDYEVKRYLQELYEIKNQL